MLPGCWTAAKRKTMATYYRTVEATAQASFGTQRSASLLWVTRSEVGRYL